MSKPVSTRSGTFAAGLAYFVPALGLFAVAAFVTHPLLLLPLLAGDVLSFAAVVRWMGLGSAIADESSTVQRGAAYGFALTAYTAITTLLTGYPLYLLIGNPSLHAALLLSAAAFVVLLAPWRWWPAFGLVFVWDEAAAPPERGSRLLAPLRSSLRFASELTARNELFFQGGLIVSVSLSLLAQGALTLAGLGAALPEEYRPVAIALYAFLIAPITHWLIAECTLSALRTERRRLRHRPDAFVEAMLGTPDPAAAELPAAEDGEAEAAPVDQDAVLLRAVRACQTETALAALARGANPNAIPQPTERDQRSAIVLACVSPDLRLLRGLIAKGADVNRVHAGLPPLIAATRDSYQGRPDAVMTLLTNGADPRCADSDGNTPLHYAARAAQPVVAALLCDASAPIDALNQEGQTALTIACAAGNRSLARFLLDRGAQLQLERTPPALVAAATVADDDPNLVKLLLKHHASVDACDALGRTALMTAALHGNADIAAVLLKAGARIDHVDERGTTALMEAARAGAADVLDALAAYGPATELTDRLGRTALMIAAQSAQAHEGIVQRLLALGASRQAVTADGRKAADFAASAGRWNIVRQLDPDYILPASVGLALSPAAAGREDSPAHLLDALRFGHWPIVDNFAAPWREWATSQQAQLFLDLSEHPDPRARAWLINHGLDANARLADGASIWSNVFARLPQTLSAASALFAAGAQTTGVGALAPMFVALKNYETEREALEPLALSMIERGADLFAVDADEQTALTQAVAAGSVRVAQALLDRGVDPNLRDRHGRTPLFAALSQPTERAVGLVRALIGAGADPEVAAADGETPLGLALARPHPQLHRWLNWTQWKLPKRRPRGADLPAAANMGDVAAVDKLLDLGLPIDSADAQGATALLRAAGAGHVDLVLHLLDRGASPDRAAPSGATPLSAAVSARREAVVEAMLDRQIAVDQRLTGGGTALMIAAALGYPEIVARLLARGADPNAQDERGTRALHAAAQYAFVSRDTARARRALELLIGKGADINATDAKGRTALLYLLGARAEPGSAIDQQHLQALLSLFLLSRADVNLQDERGVSPLHACAMHGLLLPARALLAARAHSECRDALERTPREVANLLGFVDVAAELTARFPDAIPTPGRPAEYR